MLCSDAHVAHAAAVGCGCTETLEDDSQLDDQSPLLVEGVHCGWIELDGLKSRKFRNVREALIASYGNSRHTPRRILAYFYNNQAHRGGC